MDSVFEDLRCLRCRIELARENLHQKVIDEKKDVLDSEVVTLSQLLDEYIVYYTKKQDTLK